MASSSYRRREHARVRRILGQNLLADPAAIRHVVDAASPVDGELILEVGAGRGRLTAELLRRRAHVVAYEIDPGLAAALPQADRLSVRTDDFLLARPPREPFAVVGNIPYALTSAVVDWCLRAPTLRRATLLTQWEYARKRTGDYGRWSKLTILTWPSFGWELAGHVPRAAFRPVPRVDGGILRITQRPRPLVREDLLPRFHDLVECGFGGVGGSVQASLSRRYGSRRAAAACRAVRLAPDVPVGEVWPEQWLTMFRLLGGGAGR
ncbi:ErmE/ErmH/ErmO/ErmR family 23S rRNA (adenine(2058)-N(6))-methyltransferase [Actinoplanes sp. LDG1-06]|uniref:ErmE/ErmH/ErmO/ErmR family 23S rRNA (Adenine(2058)-N(6))-methyltransferase n=1 Tax=Paractinoplanes ovalisporus TaxID=2810368 RepID=A0ABS2ABJ3_9ACTN|nr:ErmE/ErmH/ErmO/ErmR family 23S rRNA (adenine(2058)-N(6))-methyltransferase [Actinoplanes ovalisporus]MBM2616654.1 ErmE/ErmH/ErmO/ErmR family 23S rRNA (adenine(2058)-N(6))-methyltransferase [Actinoplanes ovalisporus]